MRYNGSVRKNQMVRLNKEQKRQLEMAQRQLRDQKAWEEFKESYPRQLLYLVYEYSNRPELDIRRDDARDSFVFSRHREMSEKWFPIQLDAEPNMELIYAFELAQYQVVELAEAEAEANRLFALKQKALNKLSAEERAALNL